MFDLKLTEYTIKTSQKNVNLNFAVVADLHAKNPHKILEILRRIRPEMIFCTGDIFECFDKQNDELNKNGFIFFDGAVKIAPVYYCFGNHEVEGEEHESYPVVAGYKSIPSEILEYLNELGVHVVLDSYEYIYDNIAIGGLVSSLNRHDGMPNLNFAHAFESIDAYKILICHHPEYYPKYLENMDFDIILSGHAHGGQWRVFGRGIYAPGQGLFPKYTSGIYGNKLVVSRGCSNNTRPIPVPRFFNPTEILSIIVKSE